MKQSFNTPFQLIFNSFACIVFIFTICIYFFLVGIHCLSSSLTLFTGPLAESLFNEIKNPFIGFFVGILATALMQSSSATNSIAITMVSSQIISLSEVIPIIMGANIGTTVTNSLVSLSIIKSKDEFKRAFAASTVHDFFNIITAVILFPIELKFQLIEKISLWLYHLFMKNGITLTTPFKSPIKIAIQQSADQIYHVLSSYPILYFLFSISVIIVMLTMIIRVLKHTFLQRMKDNLNKQVFNNPIKSWLTGALFTFIAQSSSVTTSLAIPFVYNNTLSLEQIYPYTVGANFGTGFTTFLAALSLNPLALIAAIAAIIFDIIGSFIIYPMPIIGSIPLWLSKKIAFYSSKYTIIPILYLLVVFIFLPLIIIFF